MDIKQRKVDVGRDAVVIGNDITGKVGDGSVVIGATDNNGNTIINTPMAVGRGAFAGPGSIAIGARAGAGSELPILINQLSNVVKATGDSEILEDFKEFVATLQGKNGSPDKTKAISVLDQLRTAAALNGTLSLIDRIRGFLSDT